MEDAVRRHGVGTLAIAWTALITTVLLNLQGAVVRATGSGAGCGSHWPTCNGEIVPLQAGFATALEFSHRLLTLVLLALVLWLLLLAFRGRRENLGLYRASLAAVFFLVLQSLVGAATVVFGFTGENTSLMRGVIVPIHLVNSMSMVGALVIAVLYATGAPGPLRLRRQGALATTLGLGFLGMYTLLFTGGVAALGNTIFPSASLLDGLSQDFNPAAPILLQLRVLHPLIGMAVGIYLVTSLGLSLWMKPTSQVKRLGWWLFAVYLVQMLVGMVNLLQMAPLALQLLHLGLATLAFSLFTAFAAHALAARSSVHLREAELSPAGLQR
jgi:heme A synthase